MTRVSSELRSRWIAAPFQLGRPSPFGVTDEGYQDYRGIPFSKQFIKDMSITDTDFSNSDLRQLRIENCRFRNCIFDRAILTRLVTFASIFDECYFCKADFSMAQIGYHGTEFIRCEFDGVRLTRVGFLNAIFIEVDFIGKDWCHTDFRASGFWNCSFKGILKDVTFRGGYLFPFQMEIAGQPRKSGLHNVSFYDADLHWVGAYNNCCFENITLPSSGSTFICDIEKLQLLHEKYKSDAPKTEVSENLDRYLKIIRPDHNSQDKQIVNKNDLVEICGLSNGSFLYDILVSRSSAML